MTGVQTCALPIFDAVRGYAPQFIFTTALPPMVAAGACAAIRHLKASNEERAEHHYMAAVTNHRSAPRACPSLTTRRTPSRSWSGDAERCNAASDLSLNRHRSLDRNGASAHHPDSASLTPRRNEAHVSTLVEALVDVWKALGLPFTTAQIVPLRRRRQPPECIYPEMRKAAE